VKVDTHSLAPLARRTQLCVNEEVTPHTRGCDQLLAGGSDDDH